MTIRDALKSIPGMRTALNALRGNASPTFKGSAAYWDTRYKAGGNSGAGSYNRLAEFKAEFLNGFVAQHSIISVVEFGSGDGAQLKLAKYPSYVGVDISPTAVKAALTMFADDRTKAFRLATEYDLPASQLSLSLDVIYHLVEDDVFDGYMRQLFASATQYVIIYASNEDKAWSSPHVRHRAFTTWVDANAGNWKLIHREPNRYPYDETDVDHTSFADFFVFSKGASAPA